MPRMKVSGEKLESLTVTASVRLSCKQWSVKVNRHMFELANEAWRFYESSVLKKEQKPPCPLCNSTVYDGHTPAGMAGISGTVTKTEQSLQSRTGESNMLTDAERRLIKAARAIVLSANSEAVQALAGITGMVEFVAHEAQRKQGKA